MSVHTGKLPYACSECDKSFPTPSKLKAHSRTHSQELLYHCGEINCDASFSKFQQLQQHIKANHESLSCSICYKTFTRKDTLSSHLKIHDPSHAPSIPCTVNGCEKVFMSNKSLSVHINSAHLNIRPFICDWPECDSKFAYKTLLKRHLRTHTDPKSRKKRKDAFLSPTLIESLSGNYSTNVELPYECETCSFKFRRQYDLDRHLRTHSDDMI